MDWNKLKQAGAQVADSAVRTAGTLYEKGKKEARLMALEAKLGRAQRELGALIEGLCEDIAAIEAKIAALRAPGQQEPQAQPPVASSVKCCPQCGAEVEKEAMFCPGCGCQLG